MPEVIANKIIYGLKNVYYALVEETRTNGGITVDYGTPERIYGAVALALKANVDKTAVPADDDPEYAVLYEDKGYDGDIEIETIPEAFNTNVLNHIVDENGVLVENKNDKPKNIALLFEFDGDQHATRHVLYNCSVTKPDVESGTRGEKIDAKSSKLTFSATPAKDTGDIKAKCPKGNAQYDTWFSNVYVKSNQDT